MEWSGRSRVLMIFLEAGGTEKLEIGWQMLANAGSGRSGQGRQGLRALRGRMQGRRRAPVASDDCGGAGGDVIPEGWLCESAGGVAERPRCACCATDLGLSLANPSVPLVAVI